MSSNNLEKDESDDACNQESICSSSRSSGLATVTRIKSWGRNVAVRTLSAEDVLNGSAHNGSNQLERANSRQRPTNERPAVWTRGRKAGMEVDDPRHEMDQGAFSSQAEHLQAQVRGVLAFNRELLIIGRDPKGTCYIPCTGRKASTLFGAHVGFLR